MRVAGIEPSPFHSFDYLTAAGGGRTETRPLTLYRGKISDLPAKLDALVVASDLQGTEKLEKTVGPGRLVGEVLAEEIATLCERGTLPPRARVGVLLAGNLYTPLTSDARDANGDVRSVWRAFAMRFRWVAGVYGNQDTFGSTNQEKQTFRQAPGISLFDGETALIDGVRVGGVGGAIGDTTKPGRRDERDFIRAMRAVLSDKPEIVVLHHGPDADRGKLRGNTEIRRSLDRSGPMLVVCGHDHWSTPVTDIRGGAQVVNANGRVLVLIRDTPLPVVAPPAPPAS
jgi:3',5'-cyclic-AMP phosphodiesterase